MERDFAHEHDMEMLRREQLRADCGGGMSDDIDDHLEDDWFAYNDYCTSLMDDNALMGDPDEWDDE